MRSPADILAAILRYRRPPPLLGVLAPPQRPVATVPAPRIIETRMPVLRTGSLSFSETLREFVRVRGLDGVAIAEGALAELDELETGPDAAAVISKITRAVRALDAYARDPQARQHQNFAYWCRNSGHPQAWYANQVVISEGEKVSDDWRFRAERYRPVSKALRPEGRMVMVSHLRISTGHSGHSPRLYFADDAGGATGQVHIGFAGSHRHMRSWRHAD